MPPDPPRRNVLCTLFVYPELIIFFIAIAFSWPPSNFLPCYAHDRHLFSHEQFNNLSLTLLLLVVFRGKASQKMRPLSPPSTILVQSEVKFSRCSNITEYCKIRPKSFKCPSASKGFAPRPPHLASTVGGNPLLKFLPTPLNAPVQSPKLIAIWNAAQNFFFLIQILMKMPEMSIISYNYSYKVDSYIVHIGVGSGGAMGAMAPPILAIYSLRPAWALHYQYFRLFSILYANPPESLLTLL